MSCDETIEILRTLGGSASTRAIRDAAKKKFPRASLHKYIHVRLRQLRRAGLVTSDDLQTWVVA